VPVLRGRHGTRARKPCVADSERRTSCTNAAADPARLAGTRNARCAAMAAKSDSWTVPVHVIMWTTLGVGLIMWMVILMMR
jgi:hypothetical protein